MRALSTSQNRSSDTRPLRTIESFRGNVVYGGDNTRIDLAYAVYALAHGASEDDVRSAIGSRDLRHKGTEKRQAEYISRTVRKAYAAIECRGR